MVQGLVGSGSRLLGGLQPLSHMDLSRPDVCQVRIWVWLVASSFCDVAWLDAVFATPEGVGGASGVGGGTWTLQLSWRVLETRSSF